jgi:nucleotide-binding universal stress UspA family protein
VSGSGAGFGRDAGKPADADGGGAVGRWPSGPDPWLEETCVHIVIGYIPTPEGLAAVDYATSVAERESAAVTVVNTGARGNDNDPSFADATELDAIDERLQEHGITHDVRQPVGVDVPAEEILRVAEEVSADMIVIGLRRRSLVGKLFLGSTSQQIIIDAECPVVTVKRPL